MKKKKGFTLIELMVVMAIIAILATAGLSAYTGYVKKARDAKRIADLNAINTIVLASMTSTGMPPTISQLRTAILAANNNKEITDPLEGKWACYAESVASKRTKCQYFYFTSNCNDGMGYLLVAGLESESNVSLLRPEPSGSGYIVFYGDFGNNDLYDYYDIGSCPLNGGNSYGINDGYDISYIAI